MSLSKYKLLTIEERDEYSSSESIYADAKEHDDRYCHICKDNLNLIRSKHINPDQEKTFQGLYKIISNGIERIMFKANTEKQNKLGNSFYQEVLNQRQFLGQDMDYLYEKRKKQVAKKYVTKLENGMREFKMPWEQYQFYRENSICIKHITEFCRKCGLNNTITKRGRDVIEKEVSRGVHINRDGTKTWCWLYHESKSKTECSSDESEIENMMIDSEKQLLVRDLKN
jgi:hypothetical protein